MVQVTAVLGAPALVIGAVKFWTAPSSTEAEDGFTLMAMSLVMVTEAVAKAPGLAALVARMVT